MHGVKLGKRDANLLAVAGQVRPLAAAAYRDAAPARAEPPLQEPRAVSADEDVMCWRRMDGCHGKLLRREARHYRSAAVLSRGFGVGIDGSVGRAFNRAARCGERRVADERRVRRAGVAQVRMKLAAEIGETGAGTRRAHRPTIPYLAGGRKRAPDVGCKTA